MIDRIRRRYLDLLGSIYVYNEHRGYTAIDRVIEAVRARQPRDAGFLAAIEKHRADERKHYEMFRRWFQLRGVMPFAVDRTCGHIDRFVEIVFGSSIDGLDTEALIARDDQFEKLCRVIALTERRGHTQVGILLRHPFVRSDPTLVKIFRIIEKDEPSHWTPYEAWLGRRGRSGSTWLQRRIDGFVHSELLFIKLPLLFVTRRLPRRVDWADAHDSAPRGDPRGVPAVPLQVRDAESLTEPPIAIGGPPADDRLVARLWSRKAARMLARNTVVSCLCFAFDLVLLWLLVRLGWGKLGAAALGFLAATTLHYALGRSWIFRGTERGVTAGYVFFLGNAVVGLVVTIALYAALLRYTPLNYIVARVLVSVVAGLAVFLLNAVLNFRRL